MRKVIALAVLALLAGCEKPPVNRQAEAPLQAVSSVDLDRYLGRWYEVARFENGFEKDCEGVTADYSMREDGLIRVLNSCREGAADGKLKTAEGKARIADASTNAKLEVSFFGPFWGDYWIIDLEDDYSRSIVSEPEGRYLWVLSRTPIITDDERADVISTLNDLGYNTDALYFTKQPPVPDNPRVE